MMVMSIASTSFAVSFCELEFLLAVAAGNSSPPRLKAGGCITKPGLTTCAKHEIPESGGLTSWISRIAGKSYYFEDVRIVLLDPVHPLVDGARPLRVVLHILVFHRLRDLVLLGDLAVIGLRICLLRPLRRFLHVANNN